MAELEYQSGTIQVEDVNIHYYRAGSADQAVVLLHGVTDDGMCWKRVADQLAGDYSVIMPDVRGHGKSDGPESGYTYHQLAGDILGLLQRMGISQPFVIGHSMGAMIALTLAGMQPDLPRAVILEDPPPQWKLPHLSAADIHARNSLPNWMVSIKRKTAADLMAEVKSSNPNWAEAERQPWVDSKQRFSLNVLHLFTDEQQSPTDFNSILPGIRCPMLYLTADPKLGGISTRADVEDLSRLVPQVRHIHLEGAGHNIHRDQFDRYMKTIREFLKTDSQEMNMAGWISVYIAASLDGFIADCEDGLDWLTGIPAPEGEDYGYASFINRVDALVMGRRTFEKVAGFDPWPYEKPVFVLSRTLKEIPLHLRGRVELLQGDPDEVARQLSHQGYERLYIDGGQNITGFLRAGLVDEVILTTVPVLLGGGIPLFSALERPVWFELVSSRSFSNGLVQSQYRCRRRP